MKLYANWKEILRKAWSIRLMIVAGLLTGIEVILPLFHENIPRNLFAALSLVFVTSALIARLVAQRDLT